MAKFANSVWSRLATSSNIKWMDSCCSLQFLAMQEISASHIQMIPQVRGVEELRDPCVMQDISGTCNLTEVSPSGACAEDCAHRQW